METDDVYSSTRYGGNGRYVCKPGRRVDRIDECNESTIDGGKVERNARTSAVGSRKRRFLRNLL